MSNSSVIGSSPKFMAVLRNLESVAPTDCTVLIRGETGTGKELIAKAIHEASSRRRQRCVAVNCAAIPAPLLESELFGYERGAFTGAVTSRNGRFQAADRGTLFLDEIGELAMELQPKLLRALQEHTFERLGSSQSTHVDVRIVAATNESLEDLVAARRFRMDLFYRLNVFPITLPPLRERREDIPALVDHFVESYARRYHKSVSYVSDAVMRALIEFDWPGNIRQLQNFVERSVILSQQGELIAPIAELVHQGVSMSGARTLADAERTHILSILRETNWVIGGRNGAAVRLGVFRTTLIAKMQKLGISRGAPEHWSMKVDSREQGIAT